ncbi:hypothetical protein PPYR_02425 [Photinus pyralis]|uniref:DDE Tnp4 domain-containing protein n=1 Tax=Photinus pyralis TaxID=7054 RepID=A0A5N4B775_PHOPY|nr:putative nuclease HARBI1 isoform X2 [Photinus pyralis]KAB0805455.1 hypothetical protein PPYR_02425 [Photinus pyralis]
MADFMLLIFNVINNEERIRMNLNRRQLRDMSDPFSLTEETFKGIYRLSRQLTRDLMTDLSPFLQDNERVLGIPKHLKILATLNFLAQGSYQKAVGQDFFCPMSQKSVSRCVEEVTGALVEHFPHFVHFPSTAAEKTQEKQLFMTVPHGFPGIIGAVDCTHVAIISPPVEDPQYPAIVFLNRKGYYSINVQIICNARLKILAINARFPGSVHDAGIWTTSIVKNLLHTSYENGDSSSWLIGDAGYPLEPWLMTPVSGHNLTEPERRYNVAHKSIRNVIERLNGVLKTRFRCLSKHRVLHYNPAKCAKLIYACAILHNMCIHNGEIDIDIDHNDEEDNNDEPRNAENDHNNLHEGRIIRNRIIRDYFQ